MAAFTFDNITDIHVPKEINGEEVDTILQTDHIAIPNFYIPDGIEPMIEDFALMPSIPHQTEPRSERIKRVADIFNADAADINNILRYKAYTGSQYADVEYTLICPHNLAIGEELVNLYNYVQDVDEWEERYAEIGGSLPYTNVVVLNSNARVSSALESPFTVIPVEQLYMQWFTTQEQIDKAHERGHNAENIVPYINDPNITDAEFAGITLIRKYYKELNP